jgi:hypothetical protein
MSKDNFNFCFLFWAPAVLSASFNSQGTVVAKIQRVRGLLKISEASAALQHLRLASFHAAAITGAEPRQMSDSNIKLIRAIFVIYVFGMSEKHSANEMP